MSKGLKTIACLKALRGTIALTIGAGFIAIYTNLEALTWIDHQVLRSYSAQEPLVQNTVKWFSGFSEQQVLIFGMLTLALGTLRWVEAAGIWVNKNWAQWLAVLTGCIYIPFELHELIFRFNWPMMIILTINLLVVSYLLYVLSLKERFVNN